MKTFLPWSAWLVLITAFGSVRPACHAAMYAVEAGDILIANFRGGGGTVVRINPVTGIQYTLGTFLAPTDLVLAPSGKLYISEWVGTIKCLNLADGSISIVNSSPATTLSQLWGLTMGPTGELFTTSGSGHRVLKVDPDTGTETLVSAGNELLLPTGIEVLDAGHLAVASLLNNKVISVALADGSQAVLSQTGASLDQPWGVAVFGADVYVGAHDSKFLQRITGGAVSTVAALAGTPFGIGADASGALVVGLSGGVNGPYGLARVSPQGATLSTYTGGSIGEATGVEVAAFSVAADAGPNLPPQVAPIADRTINEGALLAFTAIAIDSGWPPQNVVFSLRAGAPAGAAITADGRFTWTPTVFQGPGVYDITVDATDDGVPPLAGSATFTVTVNDVAGPDYTIATSVSPSGAGSTTGGGSYFSGASVTVAAVPGAGYLFVDWTEGGVPVSVSPSYTFIAAANRTLTANFTEPISVHVPSGETAFGECFRVTGPQLLDVSGGYMATMLEGNAGSLADMQFTLALDAKGTIAGSGTAMLALGTPSELGLLAFDVAGKAASLRKSQGTVRVTLAFKRFRCIEPLRRCSGSLAAVLELTNRGEGLIGTIKGAVSVSGLGKLVVPVGPFMPALEAPPPANDDWVLATNGVCDGRKEYGTATITLANGRTFDFTLSGAYSAARRTASRRLKGTGTARGISFAGTAVDTGAEPLPYLSLKGKLLGQTVVFTGLAPRLVTRAELSDILRVHDADITECESETGYSAVIDYRAVSPSGTLPGGSLRLTGPEGTETALIEEDLCAEGELEACELDAHAFGFRLAYPLHGPYAGWKVTFMLADAEGFAASATLPVDNPEVATPKNGLKLEVRQTAPLVVEPDGAVGFPFCLTAVDDNHALSGGSLMIKGPYGTAVLPLGGPFCAADPFLSCDADAGMLRVADTYYLHGPQTAWAVTFVVVNELGARAALKVLVPNPLKRLTVRAAQIGIAEPVPGAEPAVRCAFSLEIRDPDAALAGGTITRTIGRDRADVTIGNDLCAQLGGLQCTRDDGLIWLVKDDAVAAKRGVPLKVTVVNALGKRATATMVVR